MAELANNTNSTEIPISEDVVKTVNFIFYGVIAPILIGFGLFGNIISLLILRSPLLKGVTYVYLKWLAIADIMSCIFYISFIFKIFDIRIQNYANALYTAHLEFPLLNGFMASSVFLVVVLTIDRFFSVCLPNKFKDLHNTSDANFIIAFTFLCSLVLFFPVGFAYQVDTEVSEELGNKTIYVVNVNDDYTSGETFKLYVTVRESCVCIIPLITITVLNTLIVITFKKAMKKRRELMGTSTKSTDKNDRKSNEEERRLVNLLAGLVILVFIGKCPASIYNFTWKYYDPSKDFGYFLFTCFADTSELMNHCLNFCVYCWCSSTYRKAFVCLLTCYQLPTMFSSAQSATFSNGSKKDVERVSLKL